MLSLKKDQEIKKVFAKGKSAHGSMLSMKISKNTFSITRFAIVVGTKVSKTAVARNRLKRQIRAILAKKEDQILLGFDVIVMTRVACVGQSSVNLEKEITYVLKKAGLTKNGQIQQKN